MHGDRYGLRIVMPQQALPFDMLVDSEEDMREWVDKISDASCAAKQRVSSLLTLHKLKQFYF